ncbi:unnamed protein product [Eruca vesicaria subsp. sativa]|uniref:Uncharacterized protein n=1 Tax=Eruca vesicaria subsp. sativa TaxID=29727 RepID=A0ABC8ILK2_ERUVS|nr:unnamed protein product [Eruca vesicaria subsp. sativa]
MAHLTGWCHNMYDVKNKIDREVEVVGDNGPELHRKKRVASYKMYSVEGKVKGSFSKSFTWLKHRYTQVVYGWW